MQDLSSLNRDQTHASCSGSSLTHQTTKEVPDPHFSLPPWLCEASPIHCLVQQVGRAPGHTREDQ